MRMESETVVHLDDEGLAGLLDGEGPPSELAAAREHVAGCLPCGERLAELESASRWLREYVPALDQDVPVDELARARALAAIRLASRPRRLASVGYRRAAAAVALVAAGLTVQPVRAWVLEAVGFGERAAPISTPVVAEPPSAGAPVKFQPTERTFVIELGAVQQSGQLTLRFVDGTGASAQVTGAGMESISVLPAGLLIENAPGSSANYTVEVPTGIVEMVRVVAGPVTLLDVPVQVVGGSTVVDLAVASVRP